MHHLEQKEEEEDNNNKTNSKKAKETSTNEAEEYRIVSLTSLLENLGCLSKVCSKPDLITSGLNFVLHPKMAMI